MKVLHSWLQDYFEKPLPAPDVVAEALTMHSFEVESVEHVGNDALLDIAILPNRTHDCFSHIGIARELSTLLQNPLKLPPDSYAGDVTVKTADSLSLTVEDGTRVERALKRLVVDVRVGPSPAWLVQKLEALGQRSINNIVDATNFVMFETGQPVHAFDFDKLAKNKKITIRKAVAGEKITTLDGKEYTLTDAMVVIADDDKPLDIAGIKGGALSGIDEHTTKIVLSACTFHPTNIRLTSRALGLMTDASKRFEQGLSPILASRAMARLSALVAELAGGHVASDVLDYYPRQRNPFLIGVSTGEVNKILGTSLSDADIEQLLTRLHFSFEKVTPIERVLSLAPTFVGVPYKYGASISFDAPKQFDCSSFVAYVFAHAGFALPRVTVDQLVFATPVLKEDLRAGDVVFSRNGQDAAEPHEAHIVSKEYKAGTKIEGGVNHCGIYLGDEKIIHASGTWHKGEVVIENLNESPAFKNIVGYGRMISDDTERFVVTIPQERLDLQSGPGFMISGNTEDLVEEIGRVYGYEHIAPTVPEITFTQDRNQDFYYTQKIRDILIAHGFSEVMTYSFVEKGEVEVTNAIASDKKYLRPSLVGGLTGAAAFNSSLLPLLGLHDVRTLKIFEIGTVFEKGGSEYLQLGLVCEDEKVVNGAFGAIEKALGKKCTLKRTGSCSVLNVSEYLKELPPPTTYDDADLGNIATRFSPISPYPFILRDIAVWIPDGEGDGTAITDAIRKEAGDLLVRTDQFDMFSKDGRTSYAYHLVFQSKEKTLSDEEMNTIMQRATDALNARPNWQVR